MSGGLRIDRAFKRGAPIDISVDGRPLRAFSGESVAAALLAAGERRLRTTVRGEARGAYCGIGVCFDCVMTIDGHPGVRACRTKVRPGMRVETQAACGSWGGGG